MKRPPFTAAVAISGLALCVSLSACATIEPKIITREVKVPVVLPCVGQSVPQPPAYPDTNDALKAAPNAASRYTLMAAGREKRSARLDLLERVVDICRLPSKQTGGG